MEKKDKLPALFEITPEIEHFAELCEKNTTIEKDLYSKYEVKRGLRDVNGKGVLAGLTNISDVCATKIVDGKEVPCAGNLYYRGYNIKDLVAWIFGGTDILDLKRSHICCCLVSLPNIGAARRCSMRRLAERRTLPPTFCAGRNYESAEPGHDEHVWRNVF